MSQETIIGYCVLGSIILILLFIVWNSTRKNTIYEQWIVNAESRVDSAYQRMKSIDEQQMFETDDDVGFIFSELLSISTELKEKLGEPDAEDTEENSR
jgi:hypothetical protein